MVLYSYIHLIIFYALYLLLTFDYGKSPDDSILVTKSYYYDYFHIIRDIDKYDYLIFIVVLFLISLRFFNIYIINKKQIKIFFIGVLLLVLLMIIDPFGAFNWYLD